MRKLMHLAMYCARARMHEMKRVNPRMREMKRVNPRMREMMRLNPRMRVKERVKPRMHEMKRVKPRMREMKLVGAVRMHEMKRLKLVHPTGILQMVIPEGYDPTEEMKKVVEENGRELDVGVKVLGL